MCGVGGEVLIQTGDDEGPDFFIFIFFKQNSIHRANTVSHIKAFGGGQWFRLFVEAKSEAT